MIRFKGAINAVQPVTVSYPGTKGLPRNSHGEVILHGGTFRGPLRKAAWRAVRTLLAESRGIDESEVFGLREAYMLGQGVDITREAKGEASFIDPVQEAKLRASNPMLSLFGRWNLSARLATGEMRADKSAVIKTGGGARVDMFDRDANEIDYLSAEDQQAMLSQVEDFNESQKEIREINNQITSLQRDLKNLDSKGKRKQWEEIEKLKAKIEKVKEAREGSDNSILRPIEDYEAVEAGTELSHRMTLLEPESLGLLLAALAELSRSPFIGGHRNHNCGEFKAFWTVQEWPKGSLKPHYLGTVGFNEDGFQMEGELLEKAYDTFVSSIQQYDFHMLTRAEAESA